MQTLFDLSGNVMPATILQADPCLISQIKLSEKDGYNSVQLTLKGKRIVKKEIRDWPGEITIGQEIKLEEIFKEGDRLTVVGISKGKGFAGVVKHWNFKGGPRTHGQSDRERAPGASASTTTPGRVYKGKRMAGRMGGDTKTIKNLQVLKIDKETNKIYLKGAVPGIKGSLLIIKKNE